VAFPTETVYGLGADGLNADAVAKIFLAKGRPSNHPVILHVSDTRAAQALVRDWPQEASMLAEAFWPGPMTLILHRASHVPLAVTGGQETVGLRVPSHPVALELLRVFKKLGSGVIAAPSANRFGAVSPTRAEDVVKGLGDYLDPADRILDGGDAEVGLESTIIDLSSDLPRVLRPGGLTREAIQKVLGRELPWVIPSRSERSQREAVPRVSGALESHYAPRAKVILVRHGTIQDELTTRLKNHPSARIMVMAMTRKDIPVGAVEVSQMPNDAATYGQVMYRQFHRADELRVDVLLVELPDTSQSTSPTAWEAVLDRLNRAAH
jgi:L-threonylcarbamoyladenylate synthase